MSGVVTIGEILVEIMRPEPGVDLEETAAFVGPFPSGAPAIFADAAARLGVEARIVGSVGTDAFGTRVLDRLEADGVETSGVRITNRAATGVAFVTYRDDGSRTFIFHIENSAAGTVEPNDVTEDAFEDADALHLTGSSLTAGDSLRRSCLRAVELAEAEDVPISFDPNVRAELAGVTDGRWAIDPLLDAADVVTPSDGELEAITGIADEDRAIERLFERGVETVAVKRGADGCELHTPSESLECAPFPCDVVDPTGAGDVFSAAVVVGTLEGMSTSELGAFANAAGARAVTALGPMEGIASRRTVDELVAERR